MTVSLRPYQLDGVDRVRKFLRGGFARVVLVAPTGAGKCLGLGTPVMMFDGRVVPVEDVRAGNVLMGPDSYPRRVLSTTRGTGPLYRIIPMKGDAWVCNDVHVLTLVHTETGAIVDIPLNEYLEKSKYWRHCHKLAAPIGGVDFPPGPELEIDPYFLGVWFGDGTKRDGVVAISKPDPEMLDIVQTTAQRYGLRVRTEQYGSCPTHFIVGERGAGNPLLQAMRRVVKDPTTIPHAYRTASRNDRRAFLAGIIDTDGYVTNGCVEVVQKYPGIAEGIAFIARSLGFKVTTSQKIVDDKTYQRMCLSGDFSELPMRITRKRALPRTQKKTVTRTGFTVEPIGDGEYAGFELDDDGRFLLGDFTVTHNTVISVHMIECSLALGNSILFLAHRRELIVQAWKKLVGCSCPAGFDHVTKRHAQCKQDGLPMSDVGILMGKDPRRNPRARVQVASIDTLRNRAKPPADVIFIDETHRALAASYVNILKCYPEATVIGLTATPYRADNRGLGEIYERMAIVASPRELVDGEYLVDPRVFTVPAKDLPSLAGVKLKGGDYDAEALSAAVDQTGLVGNIVEHWLRLADNRRTVVFAVDVQHSKNICARFVESGVAAEHLDGTMPTAERDAILARLESGETRVVCNVGVLCEGWDQPSVKCVILARPTKSLGLYLQQVGRILRPFQNLTALILDHSGNVLEHGLPTDEREFSLEPPPKRTSKRESAPSCKTCPECFAIVASAVRVCPPPCNFEFPIAEEDKTEEKEGELVEVRAASMEERRAEYDRLAQVASDKGYKSGWIYHRFREKFGVPPPREWQPKKEAHEYSDEEKRAYLENLKRMREERGYAIEWVYKRFHGKFGVGVPSAWMLPSLKAAAPAQQKVEWAV